MKPTTVAQPQEENPLRPAYWLGGVDPRPLALFRIVFGLVLLFDLASRAGDLQDWFGSQGVLPLAAGNPPVSLFSLSDQPAAIWALFALGTLTTLSFTLGFHTRWSGFAAWLLFLSFFRRNNLCDDGGDCIARVLLLFSCFADLGACWSLDERAGRTSAASVPALPLRLLQLIIAAFYFAVARNKLLGGWGTGNLLYQTLQLPGFARPSASLLLSHPSLCLLLNHATYVTELAIPVFAFLPWRTRQARIACLATSIGLQAGIALFMKPGIFQPVMIAAALLWVPPGWLERLPGRKPQLAEAPVSLPRKAVAGLAAVLTLLVISYPVMARRLPLWIGNALAAAGSALPVDLFSRPLPVFNWSASGVLSDGRSVDVLEVARPELKAGPGWFFSRWIKFGYKGDDEIRWPALSAYLCRRWKTLTPAGAPLQSLVVRREQRSPTLPGQEPGPFETDKVVRTSCSPEALEPSSREAP